LQSTTRLQKYKDTTTRATRKFRELVLQKNGFPYNFLAAAASICIVFDFVSFLVFVDYFWLFISTVV